MNEVIINHFKRIHTEPEERRIKPTTKIIPVKLRDQEAYNIMEMISTNKAISWDCIVDKSFKLCRNCKRGTFSCPRCISTTERLKEIFTERFWRRSNSSLHTKARLIPLDKAYPKIATESKYRPIVVTSPIIKILEAYTLPKLREYGRNRLNKNQVGFKEECSTIDNLIRLHLECKTKKDAILVFIDFSSAYDCINRKILYDLILEKGILNVEQLEIIKFIHSSISIKLGGISC